MKPGKQLQNQIGFHYDNNPSFKRIIKAFLYDFPSTSKSETEQVIDFFYRECLKERDLSLGKGIQLQNLNINHVLKIQAKMDHISSIGDLDESMATTMQTFLFNFCIFLTKKGITKVYYRAPRKIRNNIKKLHNDYPILLGFENFMLLRNYAATTVQYYRTSVRHFLTYSAYNPDSEQISQYWNERIKIYEEYLSDRALTERITLNTAYAYLKAVRLFIHFLYERKEITFKYIIPTRFIENGRRSNEYVNIQDVLLVCDKIFDHSKDVLRDISILLILLETGCRPIEVVNLNVHDIFIHEKLIVLRSIKSDQRTLSLTNTTVTFLKDYLKMRKNYKPQNDTQSFFLSPSGTRMNNSVYISSIFRKYNLATFDEIRFTPKTLRHTFITNALNNHNNIDQVREIVGHKHLISTHYYFYRDLNNLKKVFFNTPLFNLEAGNHGNRKINEDII
ncbi:site-specific integrase [Lederbergia citrisecunda]|uniref:tyrosine-type recombinase/integrase n=1 Tax=Lederbergia citrisecunda TaxID=2833583 RepID=UPI003D2AC8C8